MDQPVNKSATPLFHVTLFSYCQSQLIVIDQGIANLNLTFSFLTDSILQSLLFSLITESYAYSENMIEMPSTAAYVQHFFALLGTYLKLFCIHMHSCDWSNEEAAALAGQGEFVDLIWSCNKQSTMTSILITNIQHMCIKLFVK